MSGVPVYGNTSRAVWPAGVPIAYYCGPWWRDPEDDDDEYEDVAEHADDFDFDDSPDPDLADAACDRWERDRDARATA